MFRNPDYYNIEELKEASSWPSKDKPALGMIPYLKRLGDNLTGVELGILKGENVYLLLERVPNITKLWGIDNYLPHKDFDTVRSPEDMIEYEKIAEHNLKHFNEKYSLIKKNSVDAAKDFKPETLDFIHIDCDHTYEGLVADLEAWYPLLKKGGYIFVHDTWAQPIVIGIHEFRKNNKIKSPIFITTQHWLNFWTK